MLMFLELICSVSFCYIVLSVLLGHQFQTLTLTLEERYNERQHTNNEVPLSMGRMKFNVLIKDRK